MTDLQKDLNWLEAYGQELIERMSVNGIEMSTMVALAQIDSAICAVRREMRGGEQNYGLTEDAVQLSRLRDFVVNKLDDDLGENELAVDCVIRLLSTPPAAEPGRGHCRKCNGQLDYAGRCLSANCPQRGAHQNADIPGPAKECEHEWEQICILDIDEVPEDIGHICRKPGCGKVDIPPQPPEDKCEPRPFPDRTDRSWISTGCPQVEGCFCHGAIHGVDGSVDPCASGSPQPPETK